MLMWIAFALLTAAVLAWLLAPLVRPAPASEAPSAPDAGARAVYRDQLAEIEAERAQGLIGAAEAEAARIEISRRLLASAAPPGPAMPSEPQRSGSWHGNLALATAVAVPLLTLGLYLLYGSPGMPSGSLAARTDAARDQIELARMIDRVEARLREAPDDGRGWEVIAPVYLRVGRFADAVTAYTNATRLQGESAKLLAGLAEASMLAHDGVITEPARKAYEKLLTLEPGRVEPRFWLAMAKEQDGRLADALADYTALLNETPADAAYRPSLQTRIKEVSARLNATAAAAPPKTAAKVPAGPSAADMEAAAKLTPEQRAQMIAGMVDGLAQRLKSNGNDLPGWLRLVRAYAVLGRHDDARAALADARRHFQGDTRALSDLSQLAATLGLGS
jgi:cytochrome c-type biogenesis protein CcmH